MAAEFAAHKGIFRDRGIRSISARESMKTVAFEIAEQLPQFIGPGEDTPWRTPDWYIQAVSGGMGPVGALKGWEELKLMGITSKIPAVAAIQTEGY